MKRIFLFLATNLAVFGGAVGGHEPSGHRFAAGRAGDAARSPSVADLLGGHRLRRILHLPGYLQMVGETAHRRAGHRPPRATRPKRWLLKTVRMQAQKAGIRPPEVAVYDSPEINAFATGANRNKALVAVSSGLLNRLQRGELEAVLGHEVSHVANGRHGHPGPSFKAWSTRS